MPEEQTRKLATFKQHTKVRDVIEFYEDDEDVARAISRNLSRWELTDKDTGEPIPLPEPDTSDWYLEIDFGDWLALTNEWVEWRTRALPKSSDTTS